MQQSRGYNETGNKFCRCDEKEGESRSKCIVRARGEDWLHHHGVSLGWMRGSCLLRVYRNRRDTKPRFGIQEAVVRDFNERIAQINLRLAATMAVGEAGRLCLLTMVVLNALCRSTMLQLCVRE